MINLPKGMGVLSTEVEDLRRPGTDEPFALAIRRCMSGSEEARDAHSQLIHSSFTAHSQLIHSFYAGELYS